MKKILLASLCAAGLLTGLPSFAKPPTNQSALVGVWQNTNAATKSIVRVVIRPSGSGITVHPYGACTPTPCDHGIIGANAFSAGVVSAVSIGFNAVKNFGFKSTSYNGFLRSGRLTLLTQDRFAAADNRFNYTVMETFTKVAVSSDEMKDLQQSHIEASDHASAADLK